MLKVVDLDIDGELSGDTGVWEVAWVEMPAIEQELIFFGEQRFFKAPDSVSRVACQAIKENEKRGNPAATQVGKIRGQQLCSQSEISLETIKRMKSYLERAKVYNTDNWDDNGTISWKLWGGEPALSWVDTILSKENFQDEGLEGACWEGWEAIGMKEKDGRMVPNCVPIKNSKQEFVYPNAGESKDEYVSRCIEYNMNEGKSKDQAIAICLNIAEEEFRIGGKVSFDYDGTASTKRGKDLIKSFIMQGYEVYIVSARSSKDAIVEDLKSLAIPRYRIFATGSNIAKVEQIKRLGVEKHYDNNPDVIDRLKEVGEDFDYDTGGLPPYTSYPETGATNAMLVKPILQPVLFEDCDCYASQMEIDIFGYRTKYFYICPGAIATFNDLVKNSGTYNQDVFGMIRSAAVLADAVFKIEKDVIERGAASQEELNEAKMLVDDFKDVMQEIEDIVGKQYDISYMDGHINKIESYISSQDFADYPWNECIQDQIDRGYDEETAQKICGKIRWQNQSKQEFELLGYVDGQPVFRTPEEAEQYGETELGCSGSHEHMDQEGNVVYMACETHPQPTEDMGVELEDLLAQGWRIESVGPTENIVAIQQRAQEAFSKVTKEEFYQITTNPNGPSSLDYGGSKIRYIYAVGPGMGAQLIRTSREFCKRMLGGRQFVFRYEDILALNAQITAQDFTERKIIPRPKGTEPDIFQWKGGANCRHIWIELIFSTGNPDERYEKPLSNDKRKMERDAALVLPADGQSGNVNPKATPIKGDRMEAFGADYWDNEDLTPVGYVQGLPIFDSLLEAQDASYFLNCGGITEPVDFMGERKFQACSYSAKKAEMQDQMFKSIEEKRLIYTPLMIPNILIPRMDEVTRERYFVKFKPEVIEKIQNKFMIEQRLRETNYEHTNKKYQDIVMVESWIVKGDKDKAYELGFTKEQIPVGTWMAGYKVLDTKQGDELIKLIKNGKVRGSSVEGNFILNFSREKNDEYLLEQIINTIKQITE
jgi:hypothetical protein